MPMADSLCSGDPISFLADVVVGSESQVMPVHGPSLVVVACISQISSRQPRAEWTFDERQHSPAVAPHVEEHDVGPSMDLAFGIGCAHRAVWREHPAGIVGTRGQVHRPVELEAVTNFWALTANPLSQVQAKPAPVCPDRTPFSAVPGPE